MLLPRQLLPSLPSDAAAAASMGVVSRWGRGWPVATGTGPAAAAAAASAAAAAAAARAPRSDTVHITLKTSLHSCKNHCVD